MRFVIFGVVGILIILGVLRILLPPYADYTPKSKVSEVLIVLKLIDIDGITEFYRKHKRLPRDGIEAHISPPQQVPYVRQLTYDGAKGELRAVIRDIPEVDGKTLVVRFEVRGGALEWRCLSEDIPKRHLIDTCRAK